MVCQLRPLLYSLGLNNPLRMFILHLEESRASKMYDAGIRSFAKFCGQMSWIATTGMTSWQTALKWTEDCQAPLSGCQEYMRPGQACGNPLSKLDSWLWYSARRLYYSWQLPQSAANIWARSLARDWIPAPAILLRESPCLKRHIFLPSDF
jgi:hypothetical protein